jgi:hypothetical protein
MAGCTNCGGKERCDSRKGPMMSAIDEALARLYPTRRWGEPDDAQGFGAGVSYEEGQALAATLALELKTATLYKQGAEDEYCDYVYVLCVGREPCLARFSDGVLPPAELFGEPIRELYLRVCLSSMARMAGVQQVAMELDSIDGDVVLREITRDGVYDAPLLPRMQKLVAALPRFDILSVDFGDISAPPVGFDPGNYAFRYGGEPDTANYLFYPQPSNLETTAFLKLRSTLS